MKLLVSAAFSLSAYSQRARGRVEAHEYYRLASRSFLQNVFQRAGIGTLVSLVCIRIRRNARAQLHFRRLDMRMLGGADPEHSDMA